MYRNALLTALIGLAITTAKAQDRTIADPHAVRRSVAPFRAISVERGVDLYLSQGDNAVVVSAGSETDRAHIITKVVNGELLISYDRNEGGISLSDKHLKAYVSVKTLEKLHASGGSDVHVEGVFHADDLKMELSGGSDGHGEWVARRLHIELSGGSDSHFRGSAGDLIISASGGSGFHGEDLRADQVTASASGGSEVYVIANKELEARASGGSDIYYSGSGSVRVVNVSGDSSVKRKS